MFDAAMTTAPSESLLPCRRASGRPWPRNCCDPSWGSIGHADDPGRLRTAAVNNIGTATLGGFIGAGGYGGQILRGIDKSVPRRG
jgi:hypothetical protein